MNTDENNDKFDELSKIVKHFKETEEGVTAVYDEVRKYGDERASIAKIQAQVEMINEIMEANHYTLEEALKVANKTLEQYHSWLAILNNQRMSA